MMPDNLSRDTTKQSASDDTKNGSREATMSHSEYQVEFDGANYTVMKSGLALMSFESCDSAFDAKRDFETTKYPNGWERIPPAMRAAKRHFYGE